MASRYWPLEAIGHQLAGKTDIAPVKADIAPVKADIAPVKADIARLEPDLFAVKWMMGLG